MRKLTEFEKDMIKAISHNMPYSQEAVKTVYLDNKSYDKTIYILRKSIQLGILPSDLFFDPLP